MLKVTSIVTAALLVTSTASFADQDTCILASEKADRISGIFAPVLGYQVRGQGRLYFHSAPDKNCRTKDVFVIPGDNLIAYTEYKGWYSVMYINHKTSKHYQGWVESDRLEFTGTMGPKY